MVASSTLTASSSNMFDYAVDSEMVRIQAQYVAECKKEEITDLLIHAMVDPQVHSDIVKQYKSLPVFSMPVALTEAYSAAYNAKRVVDAESVKLFARCRNQVVSLYNQKYLTLEEAFIAIGVLPDASPELLLEAGKATMNIGMSHHSGSFYWASGKHPNATFKEVHLAADQIYAMGPTHGINAVCLILEECEKRSKSLTRAEVDSAYQKIIEISNATSDFLNIAHLIIEDFPQYQELAQRIIRNGIKRSKLNVDELERALSMIQQVGPHDQSTIHRLHKKIGSMRRNFDVDDMIVIGAGGKG